jgi:hypothetical protein
MKPVTLILSLILSASPYSVLASGGYTASCDDDYAPQGYGPETNELLSTSCQSSSSKATRGLTTLNLNLCIGVREGNMVAKNK